MATYYAKSTNGFYNDIVHAVIPEDAVEIEPALHMRLLEEQSTVPYGRIGADDKGYPCIIVIHPDLTEQIHALRQQRELLLVEVDWRIQRIQDELLLEKTPSWDLMELVNYRQQLRDITALDGCPWTPTTIPWPTCPF